MGENREYITLPDENGSISISEDVVAIIAASAALEVDGVASLSSVLSKDIAEFLGMKKLSKGVKVDILDNEIMVDCAVYVKNGFNLSQVGKAVQEKIISTVESTTGFKVTGVNVHICGISFEER